MMRKYSLIAALLFLASCNGTSDGPDDNKYVDTTVQTKAIPLISYNIIAEYPHDTSAFTQGLEFYNGKLYEGTGDYETSSLRITDYKTGKVERKHMMGTDSVFGEGITIFKGKIYQLTWTSHIVYVYDVNNIDKPIKTFNWPYEGWGITHNDKDLIISDGSAKLFFVNPDDFRLKSTISVSENGSNVYSLNELEYVNGFVFANIWQKDQIVKIDPATGFVTAKFQFGETLKSRFQETDRTDVLNGIAYDSTTKKFLVTGKRWPKIFELKFN